MFNPGEDPGTDHLNFWLNGLKNQDTGNTPFQDLLASAPRYIKGVKAPSGVINKAPHLDSPYIDEQIRRNWQPLSIPAASGPQLPGFV